MSSNYVRTDIRQRQIAEAALALISEGGLRSFTTRAVAERVGITDGTIFKHFKNKDAIVVAALEYLEDMMFAGAEDKIPDALERLRAIVSARIRLIGEPHSMGRLVFSEQIVHAAGEHGRAKIASWRHRNLTLIGNCLKDLAAQGRLRQDLPPEDLIPVVQGLILTAFVDGVLPRASAAVLDARIEALWRTLTTLVLAANGENSLSL